MAQYETGTATSQTDLINKLQIFAVANGYTLDNYDAGNRFCSISRSADNLYMTFYWNATDTIAMYQALAYSGGSAQTPWTQTDDSGNGHSTLGLIDRGRQVSAIGNGPYTAYHFFATTNPYCIYAVVEFSPGLYRHFGFGMIAKQETWTGGAWVAGHLWNPGGSTPFDYYASAGNGAHSVLLDGALNQNVNYAKVYNTSAGGTLHCEGLPGQDGSSKWGHCIYNEVADAYVGTDRGSNPRVRIGGGCRYGPALSMYGPHLPDLSAGSIPIIPMEVFYNRGEGSEDGWYHLGTTPDMGHIHLHGIDPGQALTVGSDIWLAFPAVRKSSVGGTNQESDNMGITYKKVI